MKNVIVTGKLVLIMDSNKPIKLRYNFSTQEKYWQNFWQEKSIYHFNPESEKPIYSIDTPPPTVSGSLHLGHIYSYTHAEVIARFRRMNGFNVRYPFGYDNNGLPTERLVEKEKNILGKNMPLGDFIKNCLQVTNEYVGKYQALWQSLGLSADWQLDYSTISQDVQKISQNAFKELFEKGAIYQKEFPVLYCWECGTSIAQAEVEDKNQESIFYDLVFQIDNGSDLIIATTRPEFLPACVAVLIHPQDKRYQNLKDKQAITPLGKKVPILFDEKVDMDKGSGAVMVCTYGDETDVYWVQTHKLSEIKLLNPDGTMNAVEGFADLKDKTILEARQFIINHLNKLHLIKNEIHIEHAVGVHERCGTPIEIIPTKQWFVKILELKEQLIDQGRKIKWYPSYMQKRYEQWVNGLKWDWCISRNRYYGIPIPIYTCEKCYMQFVPEKDKLPVDPREDTNIICPKCSTKARGEKSVLDTWFTSSLTPQINNQNDLNGVLKGKLIPLSLRPQAHDIIRTWAFYTIAMTYLRKQEIPWKEVMISGHILLRKGEKISKKTGGGQYKPEELIAEHSSDALRYAMCGSSLGQDAYFDLSQVEQGKKLAAKLYNACKLTLMLLKSYTFSEEKSDFSKFEASDEWILYKLDQVEHKIKKLYLKYDIANALIVFENFFWSDFCDNYLEIAKARLFDLENNPNQQKKQSAQTALYYVMLEILKMIAPVMPHIAEELYHSEFNHKNKEFISKKDIGFFYKINQEESIHRLQWREGDFEKNSEIELVGDLLLKSIAEIRKYKAKNQLSLGSKIGVILIELGKEEQKFEKIIKDLELVNRAEKIITNSGFDFKPEITIKLN